MQGPFSARSSRGGTRVVARGVAIVGASLMVVTPLAVTPLDLRPQSTIAVPAVQHTVDYQLELVAASLPFFLSDVFSSGLPADYLPKAIAAFGSSSVAGTAYLEGAPRYFGILADAVRKDPSTLPAAVSRV